MVVAPKGTAPKVGRETHQGNQADTSGETTMKTRQAVCKVGKGDDARVVWEGAYVYPETWEEADKMDGHDKAFKTYLTERYTNFLDAKRREATSNAIPAPLKAKIKAVWQSGDRAKIKQLADALDLTIEELGMVAD